MASRRGTSLPLLAGALVAAASGCATTQRCRVTPWLELEYAHRVDLLPGVPGVAYGEGNVRVMVRSNGALVEVERQSAIACHVLPDAVLLLVRGSGGEMREGHVYRQGQSALQLIDLTSCSRPLVLAERGSLLCWACSGDEPHGSGCSAATFSEIALDGTTRWERLLALPVSAAGEPCRVEEVHGLSAAGHPVVRLACPAPEATRRIEPMAHADVELRSDGFTELEPAAVPRPLSSLPALDPRCPR